jgi:hypothetical protein
MFDPTPKTTPRRLDRIMESTLSIHCITICNLLVLSSMVVGSLIVFAVSLLIGAVGIYAGGRIVAGVDSYAYAIITALIGHRLGVKWISLWMDPTVGPDPRIHCVSCSDQLALPWRLGRCTVHRPDCVGRRPRGALRARSGWGGWIRCGWRPRRIKPTVISP